MRSLLVADLFCGAGGTSTGMYQALRTLGYTVDLVAVNHWTTAVQTHQLNHPSARHYCEEVDKVRPSEVCPEGRLDVLMASPECTHHSKARGGKPINDQSRMSAWAIQRWCAELRVKSIIIENVPEFMEWGPLNLRTGRPIKALKGTYFRAWLLALHRMGFRTEERVLNCADYGDPTTRKRLFILARSDKKRIIWPKPTHAKGAANGLLPWRSAAEIIDFDIEGQSIFTRTPRYSTNTLERIYAGICRYEWPEPYRIALRAFIDGKPLPDYVHVKDGAEAFTVQMNQSAKRRRGFKSVHEPLGTVTATGTDLGLIEPFLINRHGENGGKRTHSLADPVPTADCRGAGHLVEPFILSQASGGAPRATTEPVPTIPTDGAHGLITAYHKNGKASSVAEPLGVQTTRDRFALVMPVTHRGGDRTRSPNDPLPTITCAHRGELAFISASFGEREGQAARVRSVQDPAPTICAEGSVKLVCAPKSRIDIHLRMLKPKELAGATSFPKNYRFVGNQTEVVKQIGNAVPIEMATALFRATVEASL